MAEPRGLPPHGEIGRVLLDVLTDARVMAPNGVLRGPEAAHG